jgi:hypothetical protein
LPGINSLAKAPTTSPKMIQPRKPSIQFTPYFLPQQLPTLRRTFQC